MPSVIGLFRSNHELEKSVLQLLSQQFQGSQLTVVPMQETKAAPKPGGIRGWLMRGGVFGDTLDRSDGTSVLDGITAGATVGGLAGVLVGAAFLPGPVALGVGGILGGGFLGWLLDLLIPENRRQEYARALRKGSTLLQVECESPQQAEVALEILRDNQAHEVARVPERRRGEAQVR